MPPMKTVDDVFNWAEGLMDAAEDIRGGYRPFASLEAREREHGVAERIIVNERVRQVVDQVVEELHADAKVTAGHEVVARLHAAFDSSQDARRA